jgi:hypothetical protein
MKHIKTHSWLLLAVVFAVFVLLAQGCAGGDDGSSEADDDDATSGDDDDTVGDDDDSVGDDDDTTSSAGDPIELLDTYDGPHFAELLEVVTWGDRIAFCSGVHGLDLYDAADPEDLQLLDTTGFGDGDKFARCQHLAVDEAGERIYVSAHSDQTNPDAFLAVIDASNPGELIPLGQHLRNDEVEGIAVTGDLLLVAAHAGGLHVYERGEGAYLAPLHEVGGIGNAWTVHANGDVAYVTDGDGQLVVVDISIPEAAHVVHTLELPGTPRHLVIDADRAFVALGTAGVALVSLADPAAPELLEVEDTPGSALAVAAGTNAIYVADWNDIRVFDLSDRADAAPVGHEPLPIEGGSASRTLGIAGRDDIIFSSNWTEMVSYRYHAGIEGPDLYPSTTLLALPPAGPGAPGVGGLQLFNHGTRTLQLDGIEAGTEITVGGLPPSLEPGESTWIEVTLEPADTSYYSAELTVLSDDPDQPALPVIVQANGAGMAIGDSVSHLSFVARGGSLVTLEDLQGSVVLLDYFATF